MKRFDATTWSRRSFMTLAAILTVAVFPLCTGCGDTADGAQTQAAGPDSVLQSILGAAAATPTPAPTSPRLTPQEQQAQPLDVSLLGFNQGSPSAEVKVLELSDFGCGYCRQFQQEVYPILKKIYVDGGYLEWKFIPYVLGRFPNALQAATASECAGEQDQFFPMQERLFAEQPRWRASADPFPLFAELAAEEGLDVERYNTCIEAGWRDGRLRSNLRYGQMIGAQGTPTFMIDGRPLGGALPLTSFRDILDNALRQRGITPPPR
jgi:protein-disulfide isomerase